MIIPSGFAEVTIGYGGPGLQFPAATVFGIDQTGAGDAAELAESIFGFWRDTILTEQNFSIDLTSCTVKLGPNSTGASAVFTGSEGGGNAENGATPNVSFLFTKNTSLGGRRGRGRMYVPGVTEDGVGASGNLGEAVVTALNEQCNAFLIFLSLAGAPMVLLHSDATAPTAVTSLVAQARVATQRRRLRR